MPLPLIAAPPRLPFFALIHIAPRLFSPPPLIRAMMPLMIFCFVTPFSIRQLYIFSITLFIAAIIYDAMPLAICFRLRRRAARLPAERRHYFAMPLCYAIDAL